MREIKFRAWHKKYKRMLHNFLISNDGEVFIVRDPIMPSGDDFGMSDMIPVMEDVELMQYTGLKDKHGKAIYEGDIITASTLPRPAKVEYFNDRASFGWVIHSGKGGGCFGEFSDEMEYTYKQDPVGVFSHIEIIGNIYQTPELLSSE